MRSLENAQPEPFDPGWAGDLSTIGYLRQANVTGEAVVSGEALA